MPASHERPRLASKANSVVMVTFAVETKMHYPVMTEQQVAARWKVSLKTMRRWRQDKVGPTWHKLFHHVQREGLHHSTVNELLRLTLLEPAIIQAILAGKQPRCMSLLWFQRNPLPTDWAAQRQILARFDA
jgi:hypothetical protein